MNEQTFNRRFKQLVTLVNSHSHRDELLTLMHEQVADDTEFQIQSSHKCLV